MNILARWKYDGKSSGTATTIGKQSSSRRRYIRYGTTNTIRRLPRLKRAVRTRATRTKRRGHPTRTRRTVPSPKIKVMDEQHQKTLSPVVDSNRFYRQRIVRQFRLPRDPNRSHSKTPCKRIYLSLHMANIFSFCSANIFNHPNAARFPVHQIRPVIQDNIGRATPSQESTTLAPVPEDAGPVAHQDDLPAATTLAPAPERRPRWHIKTTYRLRPRLHPRLRTQAPWHLKTTYRLRSRLHPHMRTQASRPVPQR
jgi:hypothetical protein